MKKLTAINLGVVLAVLLLGCAEGDKKITLLFKYEPGLNLTYEQTSKRSAKVFLADSLLKQERVTYQITIDDLVKSVGPDQVAEIEERSRWRYDLTNVKDSTVKDSAIWDRTITFRTQPNGKTIDMRFGEDEDRASISYTKNYVEQGMPVFPPGEHSPGYSWTQTTRVMWPKETMEASTTYEIKSLAREAGYDCAVIEYDGNLILPMEPSQKDSTLRGGLDKISCSGVLYFAYKEGIVLLQREHSVIDGYRDRIREGQPARLKITSESDTDFVLKKRTIKK